MPAAAAKFVDAPGAAGTYLYKWQFLTQSGGTAVVGRSGLDTDDANAVRAPTTLTAEVKTPG